MTIEYRIPLLKQSDRAQRGVAHREVRGGEGSRTAVLFMYLMLVRNYTAIHGGFWIYP